MASEWVGRRKCPAPPAPEGNGRPLAIRAWILREADAARGGPLGRRSSAMGRPGGAFRPRGHAWRAWRAWRLAFVHIYVFDLQE